MRTIEEMQKAREHLLKACMIDMIDSRDARYRISILNQEIENMSKKGGNRIECKGK